jgi:hypothetical protein
MNGILWVINENNKKITYKNKAKLLIKKFSFNGNSYSKYIMNDKYDKQIGYACLYKDKYSLNKQEQFAYLKDLIMKITQEIKINNFSLMGADAEVAGMAMNYFKNQYISGAELMCEIFLNNLNNTYYSDKICFILDGYISLLEYFKIFDLFCEASIVCENAAVLEKYTQDIYLKTATPVYLTSNPEIIKQADIVFFASVNKKYIKYLNPDNIVLDIIDIINEDYKSVKLIKQPRFLDFFDRRICGILLNDMTINASCAQSLLSALKTGLNKYDNELKLI